MSQTLKNILKNYFSLKNNQRKLRNKQTEEPDKTCTMIYLVMECDNDSFLVPTVKQQNI